MLASDRDIVTVTFVAWQRPDALRKGIESCLMQTYKQVEIVVIDNSPSDAIHRWLLKEYSFVKSIKTAKPIPLPAARNLAVATAIGEFVVFHDDDSYFTSSDDIKLAVDYLKAQPQVAALAFRVGGGDGDWNPQFDGEEIFPTYMFIACAVMFRRSDFIRAGWYFEGFQLYGEERVMSLGFFGLGKEIHFFPAVGIVHKPERIGRVGDAGGRYWLADIIMTPGAALLKFPLPEVLFWWPMMLVFYTLQVAVARGRPLLALKGFALALWHVPRFLRARSPIPTAHYRRWRATRAKTQREYLQRVGRWQWYHRFMPAIG